MTDPISIVRAVSALPVLVNASTWTEADEVPLGARDKIWLRETADPGSTQWLFKLGRGTGRLPEVGADLWAELLAARVAELVGVPAAETRLGMRNGERGVLSRRLGVDLDHGNVLLAARNPGYRIDKLGAVDGYNLDAVADALDGYRGSEQGLSAFESFAGYLAFDALIGNTDRHHENWAVIADSGSLAPTYDHGASLGFNVPLARRLNPQRVARLGRARHFPGSPGLVELAHEVLGMVDRPVRDLWMKRFRGLDLGQLSVIIAGVPDDWMSVGARTFVMEFVTANHRRLEP